MNRRQFLWIAAGATATFGASAATRLLHDPQQTGDSDGCQSASRRSWALGSEVTITALHQDQSIATKAIDAAFDELVLVEELMSIYRPDSQVSRLNHEGDLRDPHPYLLDVLSAAGAMSSRSRGAFDITVQPLWSLYSNSKKNDSLPDEDLVTQARSKVDWRRLEISDHQVRLRGSGTQITLNGIAQGFAADKATAALRSHGVEHALINTGEIGALGSKENGDAWKVGIQHPRYKDAFISLAGLVGRYLATSGDYATTFSPDFRFNHLFDPRSGQSPGELSSVTIAASSATQADALSTAVFVLGADAGLDLVRDTADADAMLVRKDGTMLVTGGFPIES